MFDKDIKTRSSKLSHEKMKQILKKIILSWKKNNYSKTEKKMNPILFFSTNKNYLIVADTVAKYYALDINSGQIIWSKNNSAPFNSQIKIFKDKFFIVDSENIIKCFNPHI